MSLHKKLNAAVIIKRLFHDYIAQHRAHVMIAICFMIIVALCSTMIVKLVTPAIDRVFVTHDRQMMFIIPFLMFVVYIIKGVAEYFQGYIIKYLGQQILTKMQMDMYEHLLYADILFIESQSSGRLISRFTNDIILMRGAVSNMLVGCAKHLLSVLFLVMLMFSLDPTLAAFVFLAFPFAIYPIQQLGRKMRNVTSNAQEELSAFTAKLDEVFASIKVIKSFCTERAEINKAQYITSQILSFYKRAAKFDSLTSPIMEILSGFAISCVLWYGGFAVIEGNMTTGTLFAFITAFISAYRPFKSLVSLNVNVQEGLAAANRVFNILDLKPEVADKPNALYPSLVKSNIEFRDINLQFKNQTILRSLSFRIEYGKTYAIVGQSGSGKTTIANLLVRFFDPNEGKILIGNHDIGDISVNYLRDNIAMITQDNMLFNATIADNILYGSENSMEGKNPQEVKSQIVKAAEDADADQFIKALPEGYDTMIGPCGSTLSGGQKQRIAIARAFLKDSPILVCDEATSALDTNSEMSIMESITKLRHNKTTLIITHRLSNVTHADQILVMKNGSIIEYGTHDQLLDLKGEYFGLYNRELQEMNNLI